VSRLPIRWRLTLGFCAVALVAFAAVGLAIYHRTQRHLMDALDASLREEAGEMVPLLHGPGRIADLAPMVHEEGGEALFLLQAFDGRGELLGATPTARDLDLLPAGWERHDGDPVSVPVAGVGSVRLLAFSATIDGQDRVLVSGTPLAPTAATLSSLRLRLAGWSALGLAVAGVGVYLLAGATLRPVERMRRRAAEITGGHPERRLPLPPAHDEIRRLGETMNATLDELEATAARRRLFVAHASHELRTPLTRLRTTLELARRGDGTVDDLRTAVRDAAADTEELISLADALLDLGALEADAAAPPSRPVAVAPVVEAVADEARVGLVVDGDASVAVDPGELARALRNLVANACLHGRPPVEIALVPIDDRVRITVWDHGPGLAPGEEAVVFEPFTRSAGSRQRPGAGLGLAIVAAVASRADGRVVVERDASRFGVTLELPTAGPPAALARDPSALAQAPS
jgi:signal transduction histidine kinase